jgi:hypothetical protein
MSTISATVKPAVPDQTDAVRLSLQALQPGHVTTLDGAWWPHSMSLAAEIPPLFAELKRRGRHVSRVGFNRLLWETAPRKIRGGKGSIGLGWFSGIDPHLVSLTGSMGERLELLVIPPETSPESAARAMVLATAPRNRSTPTQTLADAAEDGHPDGVPARRQGPPPSPTRDANQGRDPYGDWEAEGGARPRRNGWRTPGATTSEPVEAAPPGVQPGPRRTK